MTKVSFKNGLRPIDIKATTDEIHKVMTAFVIDTLGIFVTGSTDPIPVWSGAARASFLKLAQQAKTTIEISPVAPSRIPLGMLTSVGDVIANPGKGYGWIWSSSLAHIGIVEDRVAFVEAGKKAIERQELELPEPIFTKGK